MSSSQLIQTSFFHAPFTNADKSDTNRSNISVVCGFAMEKYIPKSVSFEHFGN